MKTQRALDSDNHNSMAFNTKKLPELPELQAQLERAELSVILLQSFSLEAVISAYFEFLLTRFELNELKLCYNNDYILRSSGKRSTYGDTKVINHYDDMGITHHAAVSYGFLAHPSHQSKQRLNELHDTFASVLGHVLAYNRLVEHNTKDALTGLGNRKSFEDHLGKFLSQTKRTQQPLGLVVIMLDVVKHYTAGFSEPEHDLVLQSFAQLLCNVLRQGDFAFRHDGNQFCCLIDAATDDTIQSIIERISLNLEAHSLLNKLGLYCSFGFTLSDPENLMQTPKDVFEQAKRVLHQRKRTSNDIG